MRLASLDPLWVPIGGGQKRGFIFRCPHCKEKWLLCKTVFADLDEQEMIFQNRRIQAPDFIPVADRAVWHIIGDFLDMQVSPSIDASASGHWHGWIRNGEIVNC